MTEKAKQINKWIMKKRTFERQLEQAIEEASEFILAAQKWKRYGREEQRKSLIEETADLLIMVEQMRRYLGIKSVDSIVLYKLEREEKRILNEAREGEKP